MKSRGGISMKMRNGQFVIFSLSSIFILSSTSAYAECTAWRTSEGHECIEYYANGTDCKKTRKIEIRECVQFKSDTSGQDTKNYPPAGFENQKKIVGTW